MKAGYRFKKRKGRKISVIFNILPGVEISTGTEYEQDAIIFAERYLQNFDNTYRGKMPLFKDFASGFFEKDTYDYRKQLEKKKKKYKNSYWLQQEARINNYWIPAFGNLLISAITSFIVDKWYMDLKNHKTKEPLADNTKNKILSCGNIVFEIALQKKIIKTNPIKSIIKITEENAKRGFFNDIEIAKLFPKDETELIKIWLTRKWITYFMIMRDTGWRPGEIAGLQRKNYYPDIGGIYTEHSIDYETGEMQESIKTTKKGKPFKIGYLKNDTIIHLDKYLEEQQIGINDLIFTSTKKTGMKADVSNKHFKASCERAGVDRGDRPQYCMRHTFSTKAHRSVERDVANALMGHTSYRPEYDHRDPETLLKQYKDVRNKIG
ncbi:MAG: tyrosine-type recombinase/integrase [Spirochaetaceae bacterium]|nr:tyrosine-type recombinase/integrase [Spirochaetaceae bacterium]